MMNTPPYQAAFECEGCAKCQIVCISDADASQRNKQRDSLERRRCRAFYLSSHAIINVDGDDLKMLLASSILAEPASSIYRLLKAYLLLQLCKRCSGDWSLPISAIWKTVLELTMGTNVARKESKNTSRATDASILDLILVFRKTKIKFH